jgi:hypothetical protein
MNKVVEQRRGDIFDDAASVSSMGGTGGNISHRNGNDDRSLAMTHTNSSQKFNKASTKVSIGAR